MIPGSPEPSLFRHQQLRKGTKVPSVLVVPKRRQILFLNLAGLMHYVKLPGFYF